VKTIEERLARPPYKQYVYFFTRQDISPEYQLVQTAHVALKLGHIMGTQDTLKIQAGETLQNPDPSDTYFTVVGVKDLSGLIAIKSILDMFSRQYVEFVEPDIGNEITSIAVFPTPEFERQELLAFSWLKF